MTEHAHSHGHSHSHAHGVSPDADRRWLRAALILLTAYMAVEVVIGVIAQSLALISDAAHMLTDAVSIVLALIAMRLAARPARGGYTYGLKRAEILSAQANGITLLLLSVWLAYEAVERLISPPKVTGGLVLVTALSGIVVNLICTWLLSKANRSSLNVEGAYQHILTDLFGFVATAVAGLVVLTTGFERADAIATLVVVALMLRAGTGLVRESGRIFMEAAPAGIDPDALGDHLVAADEVVEVHDLHIWQITSGHPALSAHILVAPGGDCHKVRRSLQELLSGEYGITHATLQVDHVGEQGAADELLTLSPRPGPGPELQAGHCEDAHGPVHRPGPHRH
ncbi:MULTISPECIES: cation diffusion facilitator family transporter [Streptomyces]|uniref:Cation diffusion facilitator family transporter n=2 Tax=Streptomyces nigrescens TaxID=1920 RepID=A0A640TK38_STRNI|nr:MULTISPECIES: cation diffusion facilitator family transporter [Streptomyces]MCX5444609.1 cation diffusion facilitator family transporter [Streptomyces libani]WAT98005.1 cation diffusion facilitator family transporter [Streptomyces libani subsp. libani]WAU05965.1 cation diffusion facilitator family transporter [Streptomyces nigrescens]WDT56245.1 cation diffusion facilitator family transporter [Streptomyces sp. G7(2002)]GFE23564.1 putative cation transporter [Streptomyces libani subsp. libani